MTDHKFTDDEVIKALECIASKEAVLCAGCEYKKYDGLACHRIGARNALALINHQKAEIEKLNDLYVAGLESLRLAAEANKDMQAEIKALRSQVNRLKQYDEERDIRLHARLTANARAEAIKEFAWRLKNILTPYPEAPFCEMVGSLDIDALVQEMTEVDTK